MTTISTLYLCVCKIKNLLDLYQWKIYFLNYLNMNLSPKLIDLYHNNLDFDVCFHDKAKRAHQNMCFVSAI